MNKRTWSSTRSTRAVVTAQVITSLGLAAVGTAGGLVARDIGFPHATAMPLGMLVIGSGASAPVITMMMSRRGRGFGLSIAYAVATLGAAAVIAAANTGSLVVLLLGNLCMGFGNTAVMLTRFVVADLGPSHRRAESIGISLAAVAVGATVGPALLGPSAGLATTLGLTPSLGLYLLALPALACGPLILAFGGETNPRVTEPLAPSVRRAIRRPVRASARSVAILGAANLTMVTLMAVAPAHLADHGEDLEGIGMVVAFHLLAMYLPSPVVGRLVDRRPPEIVVLSASLVLAAGAIATAVRSLDGLAVNAVLLVILGVGWSAQTVAGSAMLTADVRAADRPRVEAMGEGAMSLGGALGTMVLAGPLLAWGGTVLLGGVVAGVNVVVAVWQLIAWARRGSSGPRSTRTELTFLFTDIEGSTRLVRRIGERYAAVIGHQRNIITSAVQAHGGRIVDFEGDGAFAVFGGAGEAVAAAIDVQRRVRAHDWGAAGTLSVRMGVHSGEALIRDGELIGYDIHCTARIAAMAKGGQILVSAATSDRLDGQRIRRPGARLAPLGSRTLEDIPKPVALFEVEAEATMA